MLEVNTRHINAIFWLDFMPGGNLLITAVLLYYTIDLFSS